MATDPRRIEGPSEAAKDRVDQLLLLLLDRGPQRPRDAKGMFSEPMTRNDLDSAIRRSRGSGFVTFDSGVVHLSEYGAHVAYQRLEQGKGY